MHNMLLDLAKKEKKKSGIVYCWAPCMVEKVGDIFFKTKESLAQLRDLSLKC